MKTERRHELQTNALADWLAHAIERLEPYSRLILGVLLAIVVAVGLYAYTANQAVRQSEQGWQRYFAAVDNLRSKGDSDGLTQIANSSEFSGTAVGYWASLSLADHHLDEGISQLFNDRPAATATLRTAVDEFSRVAKQTQFPMLADRATMGMGRAYESLNELDKARGYYETLAGKTSSSFAAEAQQRLKDLQQDPTRRFYDWFFAVTPPKAGLGPGLPGLRPNFGNLPDEANFASPTTDGDSLLQTPKPKDDPGAAAPAAPQTETPATDAPAGESPAAPAEAPQGDGAAPKQPESASSEGAADSTPSPAPQP